MSVINTLGFIYSHPLNRSRKAQAVTDFFKWQFGSRMAGGPILYRWFDDTRVLVRSGETGFTQNIYCGLQEFPDMAYLLHVVTERDLFIDIGANVGAYTLLACSVRGARGYCFEPVPSTYKRLMDNLRINNLTDRVQARNVGLADTEGELKFTSGQNATNHVLASGETNPDAITVKVLPLDTVLKNESPNILKIDVEGFETTVLAGASQVFTNPSLHSVIMELNGSGQRYGFDELEILKKMLNYGFKTYAYDPFKRTLLTLAGKNNMSGNTLFIRNEDLIREKIAKSSRLSIKGVEI